MGMFGISVSGYWDCMALVCGRLLWILGLRSTSRLMTVYLLLIVADLGEAVAVIDSLPVRIVGKESITIDLKGRHGATILLGSGKGHDPGAGRN